MFTNFSYNCGNLALGGSSDSVVAQGVSCFLVLSAAESCCRAFFVGLVGLCVGGVQLAYKNRPGRGYFSFAKGRLLSNICWAAVISNLMLSWSAVRQAIDKGRSAVDLMQQRRLCCLPVRVWGNFNKVFEL